MFPKKTVILMVSLAILLLVLPVSAELFTVSLKNGASFDTRYRPRADPEDGSRVQFLTDMGNWITLRVADIESVAAETEVRGFGLVIDTTTIMLGWAPNDTPTAEGEAQLTPTEQLLRAMQQQQQNAPQFHTEQFVEPSETGSSGLPLWGSQTSATIFTSQQRTP